MAFDTVLSSLDVREAAFLDQNFKKFDVDKNGPLLFTGNFNSNRAKVAENKTFSVNGFMIGWPLTATSRH